MSLFGKRRATGESIWDIKRLICIIMAGAFALIGPKGALFHLCVKNAVYF
jgi:hypothetical protein